MTLEEHLAQRVITLLEKGKVKSSVNEDLDEACSDEDAEADAPEDEEEEQQALNIEIKDGKATIPVTGGDEGEPAGNEAEIPAPAQDPGEQARYKYTMVKNYYRRSQASLARGTPLKYRRDKATSEAICSLAADRVFPQEERKGASDPYVTAKLSLLLLKTDTER